jgi:hypothetical protein
VEDAVGGRRSSAVELEAGVNWIFWGISVKLRRMFWSLGGVFASVNVWGEKLASFKQNSDEN